jgi:hypothetical protein
MEPGVEGRQLLTVLGMARPPKDEHNLELHFRIQFVPHSKHIPSPI